MRVSLLVWEQFSGWGLSIPIYLRLPGDIGVGFPLPSSLAFGGQAWACEQSRPGDLPFVCSLFQQHLLYQSTDASESQWEIFFTSKSADEGL